MSHATGKSREHVPVPIRADISHLTQNDRHILSLLIAAAELVNPIYLKQMRQDLEATRGIFDESRESNYYPEGMTREDIKAYIDLHPEERAGILSPFTVVEKKGERLTAIPYSDYYHGYLASISTLLEEAAIGTENDSFKTFLKRKAQAFLTNQYRQSDVEWVRVTGAPFELIIGPYEDYDDHLFGVKRDIHAILGIVLPEETQEAENVFQEHIAEFDAFLSRRYGYTASTTMTPMIVMDEIFAAGHPWYSYVPMAYNLPNDSDIQQEVGSKKVFVRNVMKAKMELITKSIAEIVLSPSVAALLESSTLKDFVIGHEASHGLSFRFDGDNFLDLGSPLEEGKADIFGMMFLYFLAYRGIIEKEKAEKAVIANLTDGLRQIRFGIDEAHAIGTLIQYNWFLKYGAMRLSGRGIEFEPNLFGPTLYGLGDEFYALSQTRDHKAAQQFVRKWGGVPDEVRKIISSFEGIPVDIDPLFDV